MMMRRELLGRMGVGATTLMAVQALANGQDEHPHGRKRHSEHSRLIDDCARICNETSSHCLEMSQTAQSADSRKMHAQAHAAVIDCQAFCQLASSLMNRGSDMAKYAHLACAQACAACADACRRSEDAIMKECARSCQECEKACREMSSTRHD
jgi:hypothetical protein